MKKILCLMLAMIMCLSMVFCLCSCSTSNSKELYWRDVASTDIAEISIDKAEFSVYAHSTTGGAFLKSTENKSYYGAPTGKSLVIISFTVTNNDRTKALSLGPMDWDLHYKNKQYDIKGFTNVQGIMEDGITFNPASVIDRETEAGQGEIYSSNDLINPGQTRSYRVIGMVDVEPDSIEDKFSLKINLRNSNGKYEKFSILPGYTNEQKEILYNNGMDFLNNGEYYYAMNKFMESGDFSDAKEKYEESKFLYYFRMPWQPIAQEYFATNMNQYTPLNETDIEEQIVDSVWITDDHDSEIVFTSTGVVKSRYKTNGKWKFVENKLEFTEVEGGKPEICEVRKVEEGMYLFFRNGKESFRSLRKDK